MNLLDKVTEASFYFSFSAHKPHVFDEILKESDRS